MTVEQYLNCLDMTYFAIIYSAKTIQSNLEVSEVNHLCYK